jgi:hypothetical protein
MSKLKASWQKPLTMHDSRLIRDIAARAADELPYDRLEVAMDIEAVHERTPLDLERFLNADLGNFLHDVVGIRRHLDRATGRLTDCFSPRHAKVRP